MSNPTDVSDIIDAQDIPAGPSSAISGSPGYTCLLAMVAAGDARYQGDQYFTDGSRAIMADVLPAGHAPASNPVYTDIGHQHGEEDFLWVWRGGQMLVEQWREQESNHYELFGDTSEDWFGRFDSRSKRISVVAPGGDPIVTIPHDLQDALEIEFGRDSEITEFNPPHARNPEEMHLIIDPGYFSRAELEYSTPWKIVWWREAIQNAVDAQAKNLTLSVTDAGEFVKVTCVDDGIGMDKETLQFKFLALGGTTKGQAGQIGGFGVAKKILCFRWPKWLIHTREHILSSTDGKMEYERASYREGTLLEVLMPRADNMYTRADMAATFLERCNLPGVKVTVDGGPWLGRWLPNGRHIRDLHGDRADAKVYYTKESKLLQGACYIRTGEGLFMHDRYLSDEIKGYVIIELVAKDNPKTGQPYPSRDFLSASRDDLTDMKLKNEIYAFVNELAVETKAGLKSKAAAKVEKYAGPGGMFKPEFNALFSSVIYNMDAGKTQSGYQLTDEARKRIAEMLSSSKELNQELMSELLKARYSGQNQIETALFHLTAGFWKRNFLIYPDPDLENFNTPKRFKPEYQTAGLHKLARTWADLCMYVMVALNCQKDFGVGWVFSNDMSACHLKHPSEQGDNENWLLLNPFIINKILLRRMGVDEKQTGAKLKENPEWTPTDKNHLRVLFALAIHECTHFVDDANYHSDNFSAALTHNTALAGPGFGMLERVAKAARVAARMERETPIGAETEPI